MIFATTVCRGGKAAVVDQTHVSRLVPEVSFVKGEVRR